MGARRLWTWLVDPDARESRRLRAARPDGLFQPYGFTLPDRYPALFSLARALVGDGPDRRLLSFGCSTGEEAFALRRRFPRSDILGIDISARRVAVARRRLRAAGGDPGIRFAVAAAAEGTGLFDAVFALAVFRHADLNDAPPRCDPVLHFADFARVSAGLAAAVRPGGLLVLRHANFRFGDTAAASAFECVERRPPSSRLPVYGPDDRLLPPVDEEVVFRRRA